MTDDLPFVGAECPHCGLVCRDEETLKRHMCFVQQDDLRTRLHRWVMRWVPRVQQAEALRELDAEIAVRKVTR